MECVHLETLRTSHVTSGDASLVHFVVHVFVVLGFLGTFSFCGGGGVYPTPPPPLRSSTSLC